MNWCQKRKPLAIVILTFSILSLALPFTGITVAQTDIQWTETAFSKEAPKRELLLMMEIPIVITAAKREQPIIESPSTINVIIAEQIRETGVTNLADIFRIVPGIDVMGFSVSDLKLTARGLYGSGSDRMLVLIDGRPIYYDFFGYTFWTLIPIIAEDIKQIEIVRGPGSALYGANAFAGVINILTKSPEDLEGTRIQVNGGEFDTYMASVTHANSLGRFGYKGSLGWDRANHWRDTNQIGKRGIRGDVKIEYEPKPTARATLYAAHSDTIGETLTSLNPFKMDVKTSCLKLNYTQNNLKFQTFWTRMYGDVPDSYIGANHVLTDTYDIEVQNSIRLGSRNIVTVGGSYRLNTINSNLIDEFHRQHLWAAYLQDEFKPVDKLALTVGARYDQHPLTENPLTPRASITYSPAKNHIFRVSVGKAFRNPSFMESYLLVSYKQTLSELNPQLPEIPFTVKVLGNPSLNPEKIKTYELSYQTILKDSINSKFNLFFNQLDELIETKLETFPEDFLFPGSPGGIIPSTLSYYNCFKSESIGGEVDVTFYANRWLNGFANYSFQRLTDKLTNQPIKSAPEHKLNGGLRLTFNGIRANIVAHYVSQTEYYSYNMRFNAYTLVNARVAYSMIAEHAEAAVSGFNLFNNKHREHPLGDEIGRKLMFSLQYKIK